MTVNVVQGEITGSVWLGDIPLSGSDRKLVRNLKMADTNLDTPRKLDLQLLIGNDYIPLLMDHGRKKLQKSGVFLFETKLGWVTSGLIKGKTSPSEDDLDQIALFAYGSKPVQWEEDKVFPFKNVLEFKSIGIRQGGLGMRIVKP